MSTCLKQHLLGAGAGEKWCFAHMEMEDEGQVLAKAITQGEAIAISDGSYKDTYGTAAWVFKGAAATGRVVGSVVVPGSAQDQSSYRSELAGIYSILVLLRTYASFTRL